MKSKVVDISTILTPSFSPAIKEMMSNLEGLEFPIEESILREQAGAQLDVPIKIDDGMIRRFQRLADDLFANGETHALGRMAIQQAAVSAIIETSRMNAMCAQFPEITARNIDRPLIVAGMPRSGTTYLLQLLSAEPDLLSLHKWEALCPFPPKAVFTGNASDMRREQASQIFALFLEMMPEALSFYNASLDDSTEEMEVMFKGGYGLAGSFSGNSNVIEPEFYETDRAEGYAYLYKQLQGLQWLKKSQSRQKWLLKSPQHMGALDALDTTFPDACVVFTHRDPASVFSSLVYMLGYFMRQCYSQVTKEMMLERTRRLQHGLMKGVVANAKRFGNRAVHVYFDELMADYHQIIERIYVSAGLNYSGEAQARISAQAKNFKRGSQGGRKTYPVEQDFGLTREQIREEFSYYLDEFDVKIEEEQG